MAVKYRFICVLLFVVLNGGIYAGLLSQSTTHAPNKVYLHLDRMLNTLVETIGG